MTRGDEKQAMKALNLPSSACHSVVYILEEVMLWGGCWERACGVCMTSPLKKVIWPTRYIAAACVGGLGWRRGKAHLFVRPLALDSPPLHPFTNRLVLSLCCCTRIVVPCYI